MNERIRECWLTAARQDCGDKWDTQEEFIERFAELIVRECAAAAFDWYENHHNFHWDPATHVLGHFGVE